MLPTACGCKLPSGVIVQNEYNEFFAECSLGCSKYNRREKYNEAKYNFAKHEEVQNAVSIIQSNWRAYERAFNWPWRPNVDLFEARVDLSRM